MQKSGIKLLLLGLLVLVSSCLWSQNMEEDRGFLRDKSFVKHEFEKHKTSFMWVSNNSAFLKYNPVSLVFSVLMYTYQSTLSKHFSANCLYSPSCSQYSRRLITDYGLVKGVIFSADRVMRCNRIAAMDIPVSDVDEKDHKVHETTGIYRIDE